MPLCLPHEQLLIRALPSINLDFTAGSRSKYDPLRLWSVTNAFHKTFVRIFTHRLNVSFNNSDDLDLLLCASIFFDLC